MVSIINGGMMQRLCLGTLLFVAIFFVGFAVKATTCEELVNHFIQSQNTNISDETASIKLINTDDTGQKNSRKIIIKRKFFKETSSEKILARILEPAELSGVSTLTHTSSDHKNLQWLYLPQLKKTKKILDSQRDSGFAGSEFTYDDLAPTDFSKYFCEQTISADETGFTAIFKAKDTKATYVKLSVHFLQKNGLIDQIDFYDQSQKFAKTVSFGDFREVTKNLERPFHIVMQSLLKNRKSEMLIEKITLNSGLSDAEFNLQALER